jgi:hypothetical protein
METTEPRASRLYLCSLKPPQASLISTMESIRELMSGCDHVVYSIAVRLSTLGVI